MKTKEFILNLLCVLGMFALAYGFIILSWVCC